MRLRLTGTSLLLLWLLALGGCGTDDAVIDRATQQPCALDELRSGDLVVISYSDLPPPGITEQKVRVKDDGTLSLPMNQSVLAAGKKVGVVEKEIVAILSKFYRQISVTLKPDDRFYFVGGEVKNPGRQLYLGDTTLIRAIQSCGDFTDFASKTKVKVHRANGRSEVIDCKKAARVPKFDVPICPGDSIIVPRRGV